MAENKMAQVAAMFGKKLGEPFKIMRVARGKRTEALEAKFDASGLMTRPFVGAFRDNDIVLRQLMTGRAAIMEDEK